MNDQCRPSAEEFVRVWERSKSLEEVAEYFNASKNTLSCRANYLRRKGVKLKIFDPGHHGDRLNVRRLNQIVEEENARAR